MRMAKIKTKQISFNLDDPKQKELYDYCSKFTNFSYYGKTIIEKDMNNKWHSEPIIVEEEITIENDILKQFI